MYSTHTHCHIHTHMNMSLHLAQIFAGINFQQRKWVTQSVGFAGLVKLKLCSFNPWKIFIFCMHYWYAVLKNCTEYYISLLVLNSWINIIFPIFYLINAIPFVRFTRAECIDKMYKCTELQHREGVCFVDQWDLWWKNLLVESLDKFTYLEYTIR